MLSKLISWWLSAALLILITSPISAFADSEPSKQTLRDAHLALHMVQPKTTLEFVDYRIALARSLIETEEWEAAKEVLQSVTETYNFDN